MKKLFLLLTISLLFIGNSLATIKEVKHNSSRVHNADQFEVIDILFSVSGKVNSPFNTPFTATFTSPRGAEQTIHGFYNGGSSWVVRFSASESGEWRYTTQSNIKSLNNKTGKISISTDNYSNRNGAIVRSEENPQHLFWEDGSPYFLLGFECDFLFALDYHSKNKTPRLNHFLDNVERQGFNHIVMNVYANDVVWEKDLKLKNTPQYEVGDDKEIFPFLGNNDNPDYSALNIEFFKKFDRTMEALNDRNIISHLMIYVWNKNVKWAETQSEADNLYFDYVIKRYQAFSNIVWDISKEAILYGNVGDSYILERIERVRRLDTYKRLVTVHDFGFCVRNRESVDIMSHQDWSINLYADMLRNSEKYTEKPIFNIEHGGYEECDYEVFCGNYINAEACLKRNYECLFAGTYTTYYWQGCSWNVLIDDWDTNPSITYKPKMSYFRYMSDFFTKYPYHNFKPTPKHNSSSFALGDGDGTYLFYVPKESYKMSANKIMKDEAKKLSFQWFNTHTGEYSEVTETSVMSIFSMTANPWHTKNDAILIMKILEKK